MKPHYPEKVNIHTLYHILIHYYVIYIYIIINMYHRKTYILVVCSHPGVAHAGDLEVEQMQRLELLSRDTGDPGASAWNYIEKYAEKCSDLFMKMFQHIGFHHLTMDFCFATRMWRKSRV